MFHDESWWWEEARLSVGHATWATVYHCVEAGYTYPLGRVPGRFRRVDVTERACN